LVCGRDGRRLREQRERGDGEEHGAWQGHLAANDYPVRCGVCNQKHRVCGETHSSGRRLVQGKRRAKLCWKQPSMDL
jgi:hypothetical protein